jgi:predicted dithiol-disulfide oxidoreductase (DUF899 family)
MQYDVGQRRLLSLRDKIRNLRAQMRAVTAAIEPQPVADHVFGTLKGSTTLSELFEGRDDLIVIHNMGSKCAYCTMWADGYSGLYPHLKQRAAFVVASPDMPKTQAKFAASRGWQFPWSPTRQPPLPAGWVTSRRRAAACPASRSFSCGASKLSVSMNPRPVLTTTSAPSGTYSICCLPGPNTLRPRSPMR